MKPSPVERNSWGKENVMWDDVMMLVGDFDFVFVVVRGGFRIS